MSNMSYCRFQNTLEDLKECYEHILDGKLSDEEEQARKWLIKVCKEIAQDFEDENEEDDDEEDE